MDSTVGDALRTGRRPRSLNPDASERDRFGAELRRWRMARTLTQRDLAALIWHSQETVAKVEKGERWPSQDLAVRADLALCTGGTLLELWPAVEAERLASDGRRKGGTATAAHPDWRPQ